jgi:cellulose synthase/poly-beta-1,6-N-acetylglucosamine synthase-like glycosyltransferase
MEKNDETGETSKADPSIAAAEMVDNHALFITLALHCAADSGTSLDYFLVRNNLVSPEILYHAFARVLELPFTQEPLILDSGYHGHTVIDAELCLLSGNRTHPSYVMAPTGEHFFSLLRIAALDLLRLENSAVIVTTPQNFLASVRRCFGDQISLRCTNLLETYQPVLSAHSLSHGTRPAFHSIALVAGLLMLLMSQPARHGFVLALTLFPSLPSVFFKLRALTTRTVPARLALWQDRYLPTYTIMIPLYREKQMLPKLIERLRRLDYPRANLDIKILIEQDDTETRLALMALSLSPVFDVITCPRIGPRTKPKALMIGLAYAKGEFIVVFDAEDEPEPDQLRKAIDEFGRGAKNLGCVQARLAIDNSDDSWISRMFAIEYAALFDALLPGMSVALQPIPLGGTSNHFRKATLEACLAWDPWNVTEDADLGLRMARLGYQTRVIDSTTWEEAPNTIKAWFNQRTRWLKGWIQTALVLVRPVNASSLHIDQARIGRAMKFKIATIGTAPVTSAMFHPIFILFGEIVLEQQSFMKSNSLYALIWWLLVVTTLAGYITTSIYAIFYGIKVRGLKLYWYDGFGLIFYSLMKSLAAWRALGEFLIAPSLWRKTAHGHARTSRRRTMPKL